MVECVSFYAFFPQIRLRGQIRFSSPIIHSTCFLQIYK